MGKQEYSLREKKHARTKIAIMNAFIERLRRDRFDDISVKEVCRDVEVAEGTFFNYFPEKIDVIDYYLYLITTKLIWTAQKRTSSGKYLSLIDSVFKQVSEEWTNSNLTYQIISVLIAQKERPRKVTVSALEKTLAFPDCPGVGEIPSMALDQWFKECVISAQKNKEVSLKIRIEDVVVSLMTIISGTLLTIRFDDNDRRAYHYMRQLQALWRGFGVMVRGKLDCRKDVVLC